MRLKPSFARKLNPYGYSLIRLALQHGQTQMVLWLLDFDRDLVCVQGRVGKTPLHFATEYDMIDLLAEFLSVCPESIQDWTIRKETALHIAVKNNKLEVLQVLVGWLQLVDKDNMILNWTDVERNTMVKIFIKRADINAKKILGLTALDILEDHRQDNNEKLRLMLQHGGALRRYSLRKKISWHEKWIISHYRKFLYMSNEERNIILFVAVLFATSNYQAMLSNSSLRNMMKTPSFLASMIEICFHLPGGSGVLQLVLPLVILYVMLASWNYIPMTMLIVLFNFYFSKLPIIVNKFVPILVYRKSLEIKLSILKHCSSFRRKSAA
ncbi:hypothetical protein UlMin_001507 [Ulmus minor]